MKMWAFSKRTFQEILRDPLTLLFGLGFPGALILLLSAIQANIPVQLFEITSLAPGMTVFGLSFMTLFVATLIAKDRESALLLRLYATPMGAWDFILGYTLPALPMALGQSVFCFLIGILLGMPITIHLLWSALLILPISMLFIGLGLLFGSVLNQKQVGGICGALLTNMTAFLSGIWFDLDLVGGGFRKFAHALPFYHAVAVERAASAGDYANVLPHLWWVLAYGCALVLAAVFLFLRQMKRQ